MSSPIPTCSTNQTKCADDLCQCSLRPLDRVGMAFVAEAGFISLFALLIFFLLIIRNIWRYHKYARNIKWSLIQSPADAFVLSLFVADILQATGAALDVRWVHRGIVEEGAYCTAQGAIQQVGETVVAWAIIAIAVHTFLAVWMKVRMSIPIAVTIIFFYWLFVVLFVAISAGKLSNYFAPTPFWCWVSNSYPKERKAGEYVWLWVALVLSVLVYVPLFLENLGFLAVDKDHWWKVSLRYKGKVLDDEQIRKKPAKSSISIIAYPVAYSIVVLPVSVVRWYTFNNHTVPDAATFSSVFLHDMFGAVNVALLLTTRRTNRLLFEDPRLRAGRDRENGVAAVPPERDEMYQMQPQTPDADGRVRVRDDDESTVESYLGAGDR